MTELPTEKSTGSTLVWVTGSRGFIGPAMVRGLVQEGYCVATIGHGSHTRGEADSIGLSGWIDGGVEISNLDQLALQTRIPEFIVHLAGGASVGKSLIQPYEDFQRTVGSTHQLLEWVRLKNAATKIIYVSSAAVYGTGWIRPICETDPMSPVSPYGSHKLMAEELVRSYSRNFGVASVIVRPFSVYGPNLRKQLIFDLCERISRGIDRLELGGTGEEMRDWLHVDDLVSLIIRVKDFANHETIVFNAGSGIEVSVRTIAEKVVRGWGKEIPIHFSGVTRKGDPPYLVADTRKLIRYNIPNASTIETGLDSVVQWYKKNIFERR